MFEKFIGVFQKKGNRQQAYRILTEIVLKLKNAQNNSTVKYSLQEFKGNPFQLIHRAIIN